MPGVSERSPREGQPLGACRAAPAKNASRGRTFRQHIGQPLLRCLNSCIGQLLLHCLNSCIHALAMHSPCGLPGGTHRRTGGVKIKIKSDTNISSHLIDLDRSPNRRPVSAIMKRSQLCEVPARQRPGRRTVAGERRCGGSSRQEPVGLWWLRREFGCVRTDFRRFAGPSSFYGPRFGGNRDHIGGFADRPTKVRQAPRHKFAARAALTVAPTETVRPKIPTTHPLLRAWLLEGLLSAQAPAYVERLRRGRYTTQTCGRRLNGVAHFAHWMSMCHLPVPMLDDGCIDQLLKGRRL